MPALADGLAQGGAIRGSPATGAAAVDMEIGDRRAGEESQEKASQACNVCRILRVIADPAHRPLPPAALVAMRADGGIDVAAVLGALLRNPAQLPALIRLGLDSREAFSALVRARARLGALFAGVDLGDLRLDMAREDEFGGALIVERDVGRHRPVGAYARDRDF